MSSPDLQTAVIACPNCGTRYQLPYSAVGAAGREVQCAQCGKAWHAMAEPPPPPMPVPVPVPAPEDDALFGDIEEADLDAEFEAEQKAAEPFEDPMHDPVDAAETSPAERDAGMPDEDEPIDPAALKQSRQAFAERQKSISRTLPAARLRRTARLGACALLAAIVGLGFVARADLVRWFPSLAGLYAAIGLPVNVVGLDFADAKTLMTLRNGSAVMRITAQIHSVSATIVPVPPVLVSLLDAEGRTVYEWTVMPETADMAPGEILDITTEINTPPAAAAKVRLSFTTPRGAAAPGIS